MGAARQPPSYCKVITPNSFNTSICSIHSLESQLGAEVTVYSHPSIWFLLSISRFSPSSNWHPYDPIKCPQFPSTDRIKWFLANLMPGSEFPVLNSDLTLLRWSELMYKHGKIPILGTAIMKFYGCPSQWNLPWLNNFCRIDGQVVPVL